MFASMLVCMWATAALAYDLPAYYPKDGFRRAGVIDAVHFEEERIVIDDVPFQYSPNVVVHSLSAYSVSRTRLQPGVLVAYKVGGNRVITEIWLLPQDYDVNRRRR